jgi:hypothetical protein
MESRSKPSKSNIAAFKLFTAGFYPVKVGTNLLQYLTGIDRIKAAVAEAEARGEEAVFSAKLQLRMVVGRDRGTS